MTTISLLDEEFERFERVAAVHGMSRSEFFVRAARRFADDLESARELTASVWANNTGGDAGDSAADVRTYRRRDQELEEARFERGRPDGGAVDLSAADLLGKLGLA